MLNSNEHLIIPPAFMPRVYSFRLSVRPFVCSYVGSFVCSFVRTSFRHVEGSGSKSYSFCPNFESLYLRVCATDNCTFVFEL